MCVAIVNGTPCWSAAAPIEMAKIQLVRGGDPQNRQSGARNYHRQVGMDGSENRETDGTKYSSG